MRLRCLELLRDEDDDDADKDEDDDEDSSASGTSPTLARFSGETSLSDSEAGDTNTYMHTVEINYFLYLKRWLGLSEVRLHEVLIDSYCISYGRWQSTRSQFGEAERSTSMEAK